MLISASKTESSSLVFFTRWVKKLFTVIKSSPMSSASLGFFLNFHEETDMNTVRIHVVTLCQYDLKIQVFHVNVGKNEWLFPWYQYPQDSRDVSCYVLIIFSSTNEFPPFYDFFFRIIIIRCCPVYGRWPASIFIGRNSLSKKNSIAYFSLHLYLSNQILHFFV